jgi:hypothetical protein
MFFLQYFSSCSPTIRVAINFAWNFQTSYFEMFCWICKINGFRIVLLTKKVEIFNVHVLQSKLSACWLQINLFFWKMYILMNMFFSLLFCYRPWAVGQNDFASWFIWKAYRYSTLLPKKFPSKKRAQYRENGWSMIILY